VIGEGFEHPQGTRRVHIEHLGPGFVIDIAGLLSRHTGDPRAVDEYIYGDVLELRSGVLDAFGIGHIHCNDVEPAPSVLRQASKLVGSRKVAARGKYAPPVSTDEQIHSRGHDWRR
jgi:hypothetical protein